MKIAGSLVLLVVLAPSAALHAARPFSARPRLVGRAATCTWQAKVEAGPTSCVTPPEIPTKTILEFALPALGLWLSQPLLSLIDTSAVGLSAAPGTGALQLAALGPATTFCDGSTYLFAFLNTATTNLYASALAKGEDTEAVARRAVRVSLVCGLFLVPTLLLFARPLLSLYIGSAAVAQPQLLNAANAYVAIRCLSFPAALLGGVLQAALLGGKDSITPLKATGVATAANVVLDLVCVSWLKCGLVGAAVATLIAQWLSTLILIRHARRKLCPAGGLGIVPRWLPLAGSKPGTRGSRPEANKASAVPTADFLVFAAPVLTLVLGKISAFGFLTHTAASLGAVPLAAHQIVLSLFFFLSPFLEVISQTAQTYLPVYSTPPVEAEASAWRTAADALSARLLGYAVLVSAAAALVGGVVIPLAVLAPHPTSYTLTSCVPSPY